jgi:hypothetical protein
MFTNTDKELEKSTEFTSTDLLKEEINLLPNVPENLSPNYMPNMLAITSTPLFSLEDCKKVIDGCIEELWGQVVVSGNIKLHSAETQRVRGNLESFPFTVFRDAIIAANSDFYNFQLLGMLDNDFPQVVKYSKGDFYNLHAELNPGLTTRKLSFLINLNDPLEYEGGEIEFLNTEMNDAVINSPGTMIVFPSFVPFKIKPIKKGKKFIITGSIHGDSFK